MKYGRNIFRNGWVLFTNLSHLRGPQPLKVLHLPSVASQMSRRLISIAWWPELTESYEKSNRTPVTVAPDISLRNDKNGLSNYAKALDLLKDNIPEQRLDVHLPYSMYLDLEKRWSKFKVEMDIREEQKYPRLSYNSFNEIATVITMQRAIHEVAAITRLKKKTGFCLILPTGSMTEMGSGKYAKSLKEPDGSFFYDDNNDGRLVLRVVVEAGHSEHF
ncbi:hypothetical protein V1525DRAFT_434940 [Lipomyces kononenkoae]|uniref:Uncharacterized protein n=1 Tax=Lipomyces kononenkoae TaxID=34357 RepID=A0ACC3SUV2_LIPKO